MGIERTSHGMKPEPYEHRHQNIRLNGAAMPRASQDFHVGQALPAARKTESLGSAALRAVTNFAERYSEGRSSIARSKAEQLTESALIQEAIVEILETADPFSDHALGSDLAHELHMEWVEGRARQEALEDDPKSVRFGLEPQGTKAAHEFRALLDALDQAYFLHRDHPTEMTLAALKMARDAVHAHPHYTGMPAEMREELYDIPVVVTTAMVPVISDQIEPADRTSLETLADLGLGSEVNQELPFCEIWCVYRDRDETLLIGENRRETVMEIALTMRGAFCSLVRMSGFSFEYLEAHGHTPDDPQLEPLCLLLTDLTDDRFHFGPYETTLEARFLSFLQ